MADLVLVLVWHKEIIVAITQRKPRQMVISYPPVELIENLGKNGLQMVSQ